MAKWLDILIPRFTTERVAVVYSDENGWDVLCCEADLKPDDKYDAMGTARTFAWFGWGFCASIELDD